MILNGKTAGHEYCQPDQKQWKLTGPPGRTPAGVATEDCDESLEEKLACIRRRQAVKKNLGGDLEVQVP